MARAMTVRNENALPNDVIITGRGTAALAAFLRAAVAPGAGVLIPVNLCAIAVAGIVGAGFRPVFHDVSPIHGNAELHHLEAADLAGCAVVLAVHNFGRPVDAIAFRGFAKAHGMMLVEDVCNALVASSDSHALGQVGDAAFFSFNYGKIIDCGHGGAIYVRDPVLRSRVQKVIEDMPAHTRRHKKATEDLEAELRTARLGNSPRDQKAAYERYRSFSEFQADSEWAGEIRRALEELSSNVVHRRKLAHRYQAMIAHPDAMHTPIEEGSVPWRYSILVPPPLRNEVLVRLRSEHIPCSAWYPPVNDIFAPDVPLNYPGAERFSGSVINLWTDPATDEAAVDRTSARINSLLEDFAV